MSDPGILYIKANLKPKNKYLHFDEPEVSPTRQKTNLGLRSANSYRLFLYLKHSFFRNKSCLIKEKYYIGTSYYERKGRIDETHIVDQKYHCERTIRLSQKFMPSEMKTKPPNMRYLHL